MAKLTKFIIRIMLINERKTLVGNIQHTLRAASLPLSSDVLNYSGYTAEITSISTISGPIPVVECKILVIGKTLPNGILPCNEGNIVDMVSIGIKQAIKDKSVRIEAA